MVSIPGLSASGLVGVTLACLVLLYFAVGGFLNYRKLRQFDGPPLAASSRFWLFWEECMDRLNQSNLAALERYRSPARIGPNLLVTDDADLVRHMNAPGSKWRRSDWFQGLKLDPRLDSVFSTRDEKLHADLKAKESGGYNGLDFALEPNVDARCVELLDLIQTTYCGKKQMDISSISRFFTLDVLSTIAFGRPFGFMAANEDLWNYNKGNADFTLVIVLMAKHSSIRRILHHPWLQAVAAPKPTDKFGMGPALAFAHEAVAERYGADAKVKKDMLGWFIDKGLSQTQCEVESFLQIIAGSDSTTTVLRSTVFLLAGHPPAYAKLRAEVDVAVSAGAAASPIIKHTEALRLPYLKAVVCEGLRLFPPLFGLKTKCAPVGGDTFKGVYYPEGTEVAICDDGFARCTAVFGQDSDIFRPERFLEGDKDTRAARLRNVDTIFSSGRFLCLGRNLALMELHKTIFELMRNFDFSIANPMKGVPTVSHGTHSQSDMNLTVTAR